MNIYSISLVQYPETAAYIESKIKRVNCDSTSLSPSGEQSRNNPRHHHMRQPSISKPALSNRAPRAEIYIYIYLYTKKRQAKGFTGSARRTFLYNPHTALTGMDFHVRSLNTRCAPAHQERKRRKEKYIVFASLPALRSAAR